MSFELKNILTQLRLLQHESFTNHDRPTGVHLDVDVEHEINHILESMNDNTIVDAGDLAYLKDLHKRGIA